MDEKDLKKDLESTLDFEKAKKMTVGQAMRKNEEFEAGVKPNDNVLDKYIKQHEAEIAAGKFDTKVIQSTPVEEVAETAAISDMIQTVREEITTPVIDEIEVEEDDDLVVLPFYKKKRVIYSAVGVLLIALIGGTGYLALNKNQAKPATTATSTTSSSKEQSSSSSTGQTALKEFNDLYDSFFTDANKLALKNSSFGNLDQLKAAVEKLKDSSEYTAAKAKYDSLVKQISAVQSVNSQFETPAITDGVLDTDVRAKSDAQFKEENTGNADLDKVLQSAISLGRSQQVATPAPQTETVEVAAPAPVQPTPAQPAQEVVPSQVQIPGIPVSPIAPVANMQRHLSRVPYNQAAIDDVNNPAWVFNPGILEKILETSRQRGYIKGNDYIIERVNIVNGNGYYNLFKPDGTYLFSMNCKTGYFVGNAKGHADALDY
ncbi:cell division site-positioning protein MapZ family protein [Streptococcus himalayensis]|uniref:Mid-cell-anchored protein Z n=1 Tax=Streptococcus himalayensis TaxID=1888195 RepID=A0A917A8W7_9STRE|nr:cell division site-positioning protein MapZ family protein [Streptococcus himalayensis]GGE35772.1 Mid-cell-anchored protein Z [Streptococcus himalayensis]